MQLRALTSMRYDAVAVGATELETSPERLKELIAGPAPPFVCANIMAAGQRLAAPSSRIESHGLTVGVVGAFEPPEGPDTSPALSTALALVDIGDPVSAVARCVANMAPVDVLVVLGCLSPSAIERLVAAVPGIDIVISTAAPLSTVKRRDIGQRQMVAGRLGRTIVVLTELSKYSVGELRLELDRAGHVASAALATHPLDDGVRDDEHVRHILDTFYASVGHLESSQKSVPPLFTADAARQAGRYVGAAGCRQCHVAEFQQWESTAHASAYKTLLEVHRHYNPRCVVCHVVGYGTTHGFRIGTASGRLANVQCEMCHGPGAEHAERPSAANISRSVPERVCLECHTPDHSEAFLYSERLPAVMHVEAGGRR